MGNVGQVNVSVNAHTAQAIKNLRAFSNEAKATANQAREMQAAVSRGNDFSRLMSAHAEMQSMDMKAKELAGTMVDLRNDTNRYTKILQQKVGFLKEGAATMAMFGKAGAVAAAALVAFKSGFDFAQKLKLHLEYVHSMTDAWREFKAAIGFGKGGLDEEMERLAKQQAKAEANIKRMNKTLEEQAAKRKKAAEMAAEGRNVLAQATRDRRIAVEGKQNVEWEENVRKYGMSIATRIAEQQDMQKTFEEQQERAREAAEAKKEAAMKKEREHQEAMKRQKAQALKDEEAMAELRRRVTDFNKSELIKERDEMLRNVKDKRYHAEIRVRFGDLAQKERAKDDREIMQSRRGGGGDNILDARTAEGWAAIRQSINSEKDRVALDQLQELRLMREALENVPRMELFKI